MLSASSAILRNRAASVLPGLATKLKAPKHLAVCLATGACALATALPANASLTFDFSYELTAGSPDASTGTVTGTISGLADNTTNQTTGLTISNLSAPNTPSGGWPANWSYGGGTGISVVNGEVATYDILFEKTDEALNTQYILAFVQGTGATLTFLDPNNAVNDVFNEGDIVTFTSQAGPGPAPVPGPLPILGAGAAFGWSRKLRRRISTSSFRM